MKISIMLLGSLIFGTSYGSLAMQKQAQPANLEKQEGIYRNLKVLVAQTYRAATDAEYNKILRKLHTIEAKYPQFLVIKENESDIDLINKMEAREQWPELRFEIIKVAVPPSERHSYE